MQYKGTYSNLFEALKAFPNGAADDDFVVISDKIYRWSKRRGTFVTDNVHVPEIPDRSPVITLFTELTSSGILTDHMGNKWQLQPWAERGGVPTITVEDVTTDSTYGYPELTGKYEAIYLVTLTHEDSGCSLWYKIIKNGEEPETYSKYYEPIIIRENGIYQIVAKAKKEGQADSEIVRSDSFKVTRVIVSENHSEIAIQEFYYDDVPCISGTASPHLKYQQTKSCVYTDGTTASLTPVSSGATLSFSKIANLTIDELTGDIRFTSYDMKTRQLLGTVTVTIALNGKTATKTVSVYQSGKTNKPVNQIKWTNGKNPEGQHYPQGTTLTAGVDFEAYTNDGATITYYYIDGGEKSEIRDTVTINQDMAIGAHAAETSMYDESYREAHISIKEEVTTYYGSGLTASQLETIAQGGGGVGLIYPSGPYNHEAVHDYNNINGQISGISDGVLWLATTHLTDNIVATINQGGFNFQIDPDSWTTCEDSFFDDGIHYWVRYTIIEVDAILKSITFTPNNS